jgi:hypothetical protein
VTGKFGGNPSKDHPQIVSDFAATRKDRVLILHSAVYGTIFYPQIRTDKYRWFSGAYQAMELCAKRHLFDISWCGFDYRAP